MARFRWVPAAAGLAAAVVALVGCSPDGSVAPSVAATAASPAATLPTPFPSPTTPEHWTDTGERGAQAAAVWFVRDLYTYVVETNDSTRWQELSQPDCMFCTNTTQAAQKGLADGTVERLRAVQVTVTRVEELNPLAYAVLMDYSDGGSTVQKLDGEVVDTVDPGRGQLYLVVHLVGPDWQLREGQWFEAGEVVPSAGPTS